MTNTRIFAGSESFDIGVPVISFKDAGGLDFSKSKTGYRWRNLSHKELQAVTKQAVIHWSVSRMPIPTFNGMIASKVSCHFLIADDINDYGVATIYQTLDIQHVGFCQGSHTNGTSFNDIGISTELIYFPQYYENKTLYTPDTVKRLGGTTDHPVVRGDIHGTKLSVHTPSTAQYRSLCSLLWGISNLFPNIPQTFPKDENGNRITTVVDDPLNYEGLCSHYHLTRRKIDCCSLNEELIENELEEFSKAGYQIYRQIK